MLKPKIKQKAYSGAKNAFEADTLHIRGLKIDKSARRVYINGQETVLVHKEFDLLLYLAQNPNRVFGREELFERVWGLSH